MLRKPKIQFVEPLLCAAMVLDRHMDSFIKENTGYGLSQFKILVSIERAHDCKKSYECSQTAIAQLWGVSEAAISRQAGLLERDKLIQRTSDPNEKRRVMLKVTPKGKKMVAKTLGVLDKELARIFKPIPNPKRLQLSNHLKKVLKSLSTNTDHYHSTDINHTK